MALNIKDKETEALVAEIMSLTGETETEAVREAARRQLERLERQPRRRRKMTEEEWERTVAEIRSLIPEGHRGRPPLTKAEREEILGYGPDGV